MYVKASGLGLNEVTTADVIAVDLSGRKTAGSGSMHAEMPIHYMIYERRDDVNAVVHTHAAEAASLTSAVARFEMVNQDSIHFAGRLGYYASPQLINTATRGASLALALGNNRGVLLRNHGLVTVGASLEEAVFLAISMVDSLRVQALAASFGLLSPMEPEDVGLLAEEFDETYDRRIASSWRHLTRRLVDTDGPSLSGNGI